MSRTSTPLDVGAAIRLARNHQGWSQARLADESGLHGTEISRLERGLRQPRMATLQAIAHALQIGVGRLLDDDRLDRVRCPSGHGHLVVDSSHPDRLVVRSADGAPLVELSPAVGGRYTALFGDRVMVIDVDAIASDVA